MIKKLNLFFILLPFIYNNLAFAASTCFPEQIATYYGTHANPDSAYDWRVSHNPGMYLRGVGICAVTGASSQGTATTAVYRSNAYSYHNSHCWCKLTYPIESKFIYFKNYSSESDCVESCQVSCGNFYLGGNLLNIHKHYFDNPEGE